MIGIIPLVHSLKTHLIFCKTSLLIRSNSIQVMDNNRAFFDCIDIND